MRKTHKMQIWIDGKLKQEIRQKNPIRNVKIRIDGENPFKEIKSFDEELKFHQDWNDMLNKKMNVQRKVLENRILKEKLDKNRKL